MVRTQIYLTENERDEPEALARRTGKKQSQLIREAVDGLIERSSKKRRDQVLEAAAGMWKDRDDLPDFNVVRTEPDRGRGEERKRVDGSK